MIFLGCNCVLIFLQGTRELGFLESAHRKDLSASVKQSIQLNLFFKDCNQHVNALSCDKRRIPHHSAGHYPYSSRKTLEIR